MNIRTVRSGRAQDLDIIREKNENGHEEGQVLELWTNKKG
jgi:hypothetical protein